MYAGSGGRYRGQNRMAPQSFSQTWDNTTNAMLRLNCQHRKPVRVIRGPKLASKWGTAKTGGGYRYDGLYEVVSAEMVTGKAKGSLLTAIFEMHRLPGQDPKGKPYAYKALPPRASDAAGGKAEL